MMILWALLFLSVAIITAILGFGGVAVAVSFIAKVLFFISSICFLIFLLIIILQKIKKTSKEKEE